MSDLVTLSHKPRKIVGKLLKGIINLVSPSQPEKGGFKSLKLENKKMKRATKSIASPAILVLAIVFLFSLKAIAAGNVTYDHRSLSIGGRRQLIISAAIHYPRSVPAVSNSLLFLFFILLLDFESADAKV